MVSKLPSLRLPKTVPPRPIIPNRRERRQTDRQNRPNRYQATPLRIIQQISSHPNHKLLPTPSHDTLQQDPRFRRDLSPRPSTSTSPLTNKNHLRKRIRHHSVTLRRGRLKNSGI